MAAKTAPTKKRPIPFPPIIRLYRKLRGMSQEEQLRWALENEKAPEKLAECVAESIEIFTPYENEGEGFGATKSPSLPGKIGGGNDLARALAAGGSTRGSWTISYGRQRVHFQFVDYEVPPARTTKDSPKFLGRFDEEGCSSLYVRADLLLRARDGVPVLGEAKVTRPNGFDSTPVVAFVQALAGGVLLATPSQLRRVRDAYEDMKFNSAAGCVDLALFFYKPKNQSGYTFQRRLEAVSWVLAHRVLGHASFPRERIRRVSFVEASGPPQALSMRIWAVEP